MRFRSGLRGNCECHSHNLHHYDSCIYFVHIKAPDREGKLIAGLLGHTHAPKLEVVNMGPLKSRGVIAAEPIPRGSYVCEYRSRSSSLLATSVNTLLQSNTLPLRSAAILSNCILSSRAENRTTFTTNVIIWEEDRHPFPELNSHPTCLYSYCT